MSVATETKQVVGICREITEKNGWVEFSVDAGTQYPVRLSTKLPALIEQARAVGDALGSWTYKESQGKENPNRPGTFYTNRYLEGVTIGGEQQSPNGDPHRAPMHAGDKDRAITRMAVLKAVAELYHGSLGDNDTDNDVVVLKVMETAGRFERWIMRDIDEVPFD